MSLSFTQKPVVDTGNPVPVLTNWTPAIGYMVLKSASIASLFYYKLVLEVRKDDASGTLFAKLKQRRNGHSTDITNNYARAFFDVRDIVNSQLIETEYDNNYTVITDRKSIHRVGQNDNTTIFSTSGNKELGIPQVIKIFVKAYENYSSSATTSPTDQTGNAINMDDWYFAASFPLEQARNPGSAYIQPATAFDGYTMRNQNSRFLSDAPYQNDPAVASGGNRIINYINTYDYHTLAFFNNFDEFESKPIYFEIVYYKADGTIAGNGEKHYIENKADNGGFDPEDTSTSDYDKLLYFGCGAKNLEESQVAAYNGSSFVANAAAPSNFTGWVYYSVRACTKYESLSDADYTSVPYVFVKESGSCKDYKMRRLAWISSKGGWDYFNFKLKSTRTIEVTRNNYNSILGVYGGEKYAYTNTQRGKRTRNVEAVRKEVINTDWITETQAEFLENLFKSKNVNLVQSSFTDYNFPVLITDTSFVKKTNANDRLRIQYTINIEYANPVNTNS